MTSVNGVHCLEILLRRMYSLAWWSTRWVRLPQASAGSFRVNVLCYALTGAVSYCTADILAQEAYI